MFIDGRRSGGRRRQTAIDDDDAVSDVELQRCFGAGNFSRFAACLADLLVDGDTATQVIGGYMGKQALKNFIAWSEMKQATSSKPKRAGTKVR